MFPFCANCGVEITDAVARHVCTTRIRPVDVMRQAPRGTVIADEKADWYICYITEGWWDLTYEMFRTNEEVWEFLCNGIDNWQIRDSSPRSITPKRETWRADR